MTEETDSQQRNIGWKENLRAVLGAGRRLLATRAGIFREEIAQKGEQLGRGCAGVAVALFFGWIALLLLTAFVAVLLSRLFGSAIAGIGVTLLLYGGIAAGGALFAGKAFSRIRPLDFPVTAAELAKDWSAVKASALPPAESSATGGDVPAEDLEARFRAGSE